LTRFLDAEFGGYTALDSDGRACFEQLLSCEDDQLIDWLLNGQLPTEDGLGDLVQRIRAASGLPT